MRLFRRSRGGKGDADRGIWGISGGVMEMILGASRDTYPREFMGMLRAERGVVEELILLPGTTSGDSHATFYRHMLPIDFSVVGTAHSHPSSSPYPSNADLHLFRRYGRVHIISARPYTMRSWRAYDSRGEEMELKVL